MNGKTIKLSEVHKGSLDAIFQGSMIKVVENIQDPNTDVKKAREINIKIQFKPDPDDRGKAEMIVSCIEKLAPRKNLESTFFSGINIDTGEVAMREHVDIQPSLFPEIQPESYNVVPFEEYAKQKQN